jgi:predicted nucleotidyltransferase
MSIQLPKDFKLISKFLAGSHLYGTNTPDSDTDTRGVFIPPKEYFLGFAKRAERFSDKVTDIEYHNIQHFFKLALKCNPNIIEFLFIPSEQMITSSKEWEIIIENKDLFLSNKAKYTFTGYAFSQMKRIKNHRAWLLNPPKKKPEREDFGLPPYKSLLSRDKIGAFNEIIANYLKQIGAYHDLKDNLLEMEEVHNYKAIIENTSKLDFKAIGTIVPISDNIMQALEKEKAYSSSLMHWTQYQNWLKNRNPARAKLEAKFGFDSKHFLHLARLMSEAKELLTTGKIIFPRPDREYLLDIKNGVYTFEHLLEKFDKINDEMEEIQKSSILPKKPQINKADDLCIKIVDRYLESKTSQTSSDRKTESHGS